MTGCVCTSPGFCERHQCRKTEAWWQLCQTRPDYFQLWEEGRGPGQKRTAQQRKKRRKRCGERSPPTARKVGTAYVSQTKDDVTYRAYQRRRAICGMCEHYYAVGRCKLVDLGCGRTYAARLRSRHYSCPIGKWDDIDPEMLLPEIERPAIICCYYNTCGFTKPLRNYFRFAEGMRLCGAELWTVELVFDDQEYSLPEAQLHIRGNRERNLLWQKERILNLLIQRLPADVDAIGWFDADIVFNDEEWLPKSRELLRRYQIMQPWGKVMFLDHIGRPGWSPYSCAWYWHNDRGMCNLPGIAHPGFAWIARAELLRKHGLYESMIVGGGDTMMVPGWTNLQVEAIDFLNDGWRKHAAEWAQAMYADVQGFIGYLPGAIRHLFHGSLTNRQYAKRWRESRQGKFDPATDLEIDDNGLLAWTPDALASKMPMINWIRRYFEERREDG